MDFIPTTVRTRNQKGSKNRGTGNKYNQGPWRLKDESSEMPESIVLVLRNI